MTYHDFSSDQLKWIQPYHNGMQLIYKSNYGNYDTIIIADTWNGYESAPPSDCVSYDAYAMAQLRNKPKGFPSLGFGIDMSNHDGFNGQFYSGYVQMNLASPSPVYDSVFIYNHYYNSVYISSVDSNSIPQSAIWRVYFNKTIGVLKFDEKGGESFERIN